MEDLNYLYQRQQVSLMAAETSLTSEGRASQRALARAYGRKIDQVRADLGATGSSAAIL